MFILGAGNLEYALSRGLGGIIFFSDDICSFEQFKSVVLNLKQSAKIPPFLSIDQEGGRVERTINIHERHKSQKYAFQKGMNFLINQTINIAYELESYGINMNFAPCLDVNTNCDNPIIGDRSFSNNPYEVCAGYDVVSNIYRIFKIISVVKHFPGHGDTSADSHKELPEICLSLNEMESTHILPFKHAIEYGADAVMAGHIHCKCFDKEVIPASLSKNCLGYLRNKLGFNGVIISDDMLMNGVGGDADSEICIKGIKSGINVFIYRNSHNNVLKVIEDIIKRTEIDKELCEYIDTSYNKIIKLKKSYGIIT